MTHSNDFSSSPQGGQTPPNGEQSPPNLDRIQYFLGIVQNAQRPLRQLQSALETAADFAIAPLIVGSLIERLAEAGTLDYLGIYPETASDLANLLTWQDLGSEAVSDE